MSNGVSTVQHDTIYKYSCRNALAAYLNVAHILSRPLWASPHCGPAVVAAVAASGAVRRSQSSERGHYLASGSRVPSQSARPPLAVRVAPAGGDGVGTAALGRAGAASHSVSASPLEVDATDSVLESSCHTIVP